MGWLIGLGIAYAVGIFVTALVGLVMYTTEYEDSQKAIGARLMFACILWPGLLLGAVLKVYASAKETLLAEQEKEEK